MDEQKVGDFIEPGASASVLRTSTEVLFFLLDHGLDTSILDVACGSGQFCISSRL
jgi:ubiquinone/menaquinone biosynthesis C-methylase UbiE